MKQDRRFFKIWCAVLIALGLALLSVGAWPASAEVYQLYTVVQPLLRHRHEPALTMLDLFRDRPSYPTWPVQGRDVGTTGIFFALVGTSKLSLWRISFPAMWLLWSAGGMIVVGIGALWWAFKAPNPRRNLINLDLNPIRLKRKATELPVLQVGRHRYGLRTRKIQRSALLTCVLRVSPALASRVSPPRRQEYGCVLVVGPPGRGKSTLARSWLISADDVSYIVIDLKGELFAASGAHRRRLGRVYEIDLTSSCGYSVDPFATDDRSTVVGILEAFLPTEEGDNKFFPRSAQQIGMLIWQLARANNLPGLVVTIILASQGLTDIVSTLRGLMAGVNATKREAIDEAVGGVFDSAVWNDPDQGGKGKGSAGDVLATFQAAFAASLSSNLLTTLLSSPVSIEDLISEPFTLYLRLPGTDAPYRQILEAVLGDILFTILRPPKREAHQQDIVLIADEAGRLRIPHFEAVLATGRGFGLTMAAFVQTIGQLRQYGSAESTMAMFAHKVFFRSDEAAVNEYLRGRAGYYDQKKPSGSGQNTEQYSKISAYDELEPAWEEWCVMAVLDDKRSHVLYGTPIPQPFTPTTNSQQETAAESRMGELELVYERLRAARAVGQAELRALKASAQPRNDPTGLF